MGDVEFIEDEHEVDSVVHGKMSEAAGGWRHV